MSDDNIPRKRKAEELEVEEITPIKVRDRPNIDTLQEMMNGRPYVAQMVQTQLFYDLCSMTEELLDKIAKLGSLVESQIPEGKSLPREYTVTSAKIEVIDRKEENTLPWRSVDITNFGPDKAYISINENFSRDTASFAKGETMMIDFRQAKIAKILIKSDGTSTVRVLATK